MRNRPGDTFMCSVCGRKPPIRQYADHAFDMPKFLADVGVEIRREGKPFEGGMLYELTVCPWNPAHGERGEASVIVWPDGRRSARCFHNSCQGRDWSSFKAATNLSARIRRNSYGY